MSFLHKKTVATESNMDAWLLSYADMITLFLCFFAVLIAMSVPKKEALQKVQQDIAEQFTGSGSNTGGGNGFLEQENMVSEIRSMMYVNQFHRDMTIEETPKGIILDFRSAAFYDAGSAEIKEQGQSLLQQLATTMLRVENMGYTIEVEGHTDDSPIRTAHFPSNWELSTARATSVVRFLIDQGLEAKRFKAAGYADIFPKVPNRTASGIAIPANQAINRRIVVKLVRPQ